MALDIINLKLSAQRALLGNVFPSLKAVCVNISDNLVYVYFYVDQEISEDSMEYCQSTMDNIIADFCNITYNGKEIEFEAPVICLDAQEKPVLKGYWVYYKG